MSREVVAPITGEVLDLDAETDVLASVRDTLKLLRAEIDMAASKIDEELASRLDAANRRSVNVGGFTLKVNAPETTEWDSTALQIALAAMVEAEILHPSVMHETIKRTVLLKVDSRSAQRLLTHPDQRVRDAVAACATTKQQVRRVSVSPAALH